MLNISTENLSQEQKNAIRLKSNLTQSYMNDINVVNWILECFNNNLSYQETAEKVIPLEYKKSASIAIHIVWEITRLFVESKENKLSSTATKISNGHKRYLKDNPEHKDYLSKIAERGRESQWFKSRSNEEVITLKTIINDSNFKFRNDVLDISKITTHLNELYWEKRHSRTNKEVASYINNIIKTSEDKNDKEPNRSNEEIEYLINMLNNDYYRIWDSFKYSEITKDFSQKFPNKRTDKGIFEKFSRLKREILWKKEIVRLSRSNQELEFLDKCLDDKSLIWTNKYNPNAIDVNKLVQIYRKTFPDQEKTKGQIYTMLNKRRKTK